MNIDLLPIELNERQFNKLSQIVHQLTGIKLKPGKEELVKSRLTKRLRNLGITNFTDYINYIDQDSSKIELATMIDLLTTNKTSFFREPQHFYYLQEHLLSKLQRQSKIRIWSAGCSSGEEPYSIAIFLKEHLQGIDRIDVRILATDISQRMLKKARAACYSRDKLKDVPEELLKKYFTTDDSQSYQIRAELRAMVSIAHLNLMQRWPMKGPFDIIFCRNVMIYFEKDTQQDLVNRFWKILRPEGFLFVGHSESMAGLTHHFRYVQPAIYQK